MVRGSPHPAPMAFLVAGTLQVASQIADARESLGRKVGGALPGLACSRLSAEPHPGATLALPPQGKYSMRGPRVALTLSSPEVSASIVAVLEGVFRTLGFESCQRREASVQVSPHLPPASTSTPTPPPPLLLGLPGLRPSLCSCPRASLGSWPLSGSSWMPSGALWAVP